MKPERAFVPPGSAGELDSRKPDPCAEATADLTAAEERNAILAQLAAAFSRLPPRTRRRCACPPKGDSLTDAFVFAEANDISQQHVEGVVVDGERDEDGQWLLDGEFTVFTTDEELLIVHGWSCHVQIEWREDSQADAGGSERRVRVGEMAR